MLLHIPVAGAEIPFLFIVLYLSRRFGENNCIGALTCGTIFIGLVLLIVLQNQPAAISGLFLINVAPTFMMVLRYYQTTLVVIQKKCFIMDHMLLRFVWGILQAHFLLTRVITRKTQVIVKINLCLITFFFLTYNGN